MTVSHPKRCPRCGDRALVDILYGTPENRELRGLWARGKVMIRPRRETDDLSPGWCCRECGLEWADTRAPAALQLRRSSICHEVAVPADEVGSSRISRAGAA